tara:strand:+ start:114 stop:455 length:342 start_codon:yes stop_codon:yes gene_type:complete
MKISELLNEYLSLENDLVSINNKAKKIREKKNQMSATILNFMKQKNLSDLKYNNSLFLTKDNKSYSTISQKLLKESIFNYFKGDKDKTEELLKYILNNRAVSHSVDLVKKNKI